MSGTYRGRDGGGEAPGRSGGPSLKLSDYQRREAASMLDAGKSRADVAALLGVHVGTLRRALKSLDDLGGTPQQGKISGPCTGKKTGLATGKRSLHECPSGIGSASALCPGDATGTRSGVPLPRGVVLPTHILQLR
jgi:Helix-turn-helix domain